MSKQNEIQEGGSQSEGLASPFDAMLFHSSAAQCFKEMAGSNDMPLGFPSTDIAVGGFSTRSLTAFNDTPKLNIKPLSMPKELATPA